MDNKLGYVAELQSEIVSQLNSTLGTNFENLGDLSNFKRALPADMLKLQDLCLFFEKEFLRAKEGKAYFSACLSGAAMIEGFLLLLCSLFKDIVVQSAAYTKVAKGKKFEDVSGKLTLETLVEIAESLSWISPHTVRTDLKVSISEAYEEIATSRQLDPAQIAIGKQALIDHPGIALLGLMKDMRNLLHAGRWTRQNRAFNQEAFEQWSQLVVFAIAEIRDCLAIKMTLSIQERLTSALQKLGMAARV